MAALLGIDVDRTISLTFVIGAALAAVAGTMYLLYYGVVDFADGFVPGVKAFTAAVLGGIGSLPGAVLGGLIIGLIETFWSAYFSIEYKDVAAFSILAIVLDLHALRHPRPTGSREGLRRHGRAAGGNATGLRRRARRSRRDARRPRRRAQGRRRSRRVIAFGLSRPDPRLPHRPETGERAHPAPALGARRARLRPRLRGAPRRATPVRATRRRARPRPQRARDRPLAAQRPPARRQARPAGLPRHRAHLPAPRLPRAGRPDASRATGSTSAS